MCDGDVIDRNIKSTIHEAENIYDRQAQLDKAEIEMRRRRTVWNFLRRLLSTFFYEDDEAISISSNGA